MAEFIESTLTSKGQVTVPHAIREALRLAAGDRLVWRLAGAGRLEVRKVPRRTLSDLVGMLGRPDRSATVEEFDEAIRERMRAAAHGEH